MKKDDKHLHTLKEWEENMPAGVEFTNIELSGGKVTRVDGYETYGSERALVWKNNGECSLVAMKDCNHPLRFLTREIEANLSAQDALIVDIVYTRHSENDIRFSEN